MENITSMSNTCCPLYHRFISALGATECNASLIDNLISIPRRMNNRVYCRVVHQTKGNILIFFYNMVSYELLINAQKIDRHCNERVLFFVCKATIRSKYNEIKKQKLLAFSCRIIYSYHNAKHKLELQPKLNIM